MAISRGRKETWSKNIQIHDAYRYELHQANKVDIQASLRFLETPGAHCVGPSLVTD
jgi:hypothetical protein